MFFWKKKRQKISAYLGSCTFHIKVKKLKSWRDNLEYVYFCVNTFRFGWFDLNGTLCRQRPCRFGCECVIGLSPNPFSFGNSCLMIYNMWMHFQVWFRMAWNSIYFEKTIPFVPCMKYDFCAFFSPSIIRKIFWIGSMASTATCHKLLGNKTPRPSNPLNDHKLTLRLHSFSANLNTFTRMG